ncbi:MFS transporter [Acinetobacter sp. C26M]|uniref:MFS transporter n=1 Tax=unclassified Acinetobacter TaxID=196816 RepID=UPI002036FCDE|nr:MULTISPECIES: MFS transporter [unclassified Acinetobacter]USA46835.1 MFS transporter [Acinetobacter sp. C26M]USA50319.1 MFS transporter [Acinetobacter sp. C26G]
MTSKLNDRLLIAALYTSTFLCLVDLSSVNLALNAIQTQFNSHLADLQWVIDSYALSMSSLMLAVGALSQWLGRKRLWLTGVVIFIFGSVICAAAPDFSLLIAGRVIQGVAGAMLIPLTLAIIVHHFTQVDRKAREIGNWSSFSAFALIIGPLIGGLMVHYWGWKSIFWLNLPVGLLALFLGWKGIVADEDQQKMSFDYLGLIYSVVAIATLTYSIIMVQQAHMGYLIVFSFLLSIIFTLIFIRHQNKVLHPLVPRHLLHNRMFLQFNLISFLLGFAGYSSLFVFALFYQEQVHLSAAQAGWLIAPQFLMQALVSIWFGRLQQSYGVLSLLRIGLLISGFALIAMVSFQSNSSYLLFIGLSGMMGAGIGLIVPSSSTLSLHAVSQADASFAAAILNMLRQLGLTFGIAVLGTLTAFIIEWTVGVLHYSMAQAQLLAFHIVVAIMGGLFIAAMLGLRKIKQQECVAPISS